MAIINYPNIVIQKELTDDLGYIPVSVQIASLAELRLYYILEKAKLIEHIDTVTLYGVSTNPKVLQEMVLPLENDRNLFTAAFHFQPATGQPLVRCTIKITSEAAAKSANKALISALKDGKKIPQRNFATIIAKYQEQSAIAVAPHEALSENLNPSVPNLRDKITFYAQLFENYMIVHRAIEIREEEGIFDQPKIDSQRDEVKRLIKNLSNTFSTTIEDLLNAI